jgi:capsular exopolysaccharide synthesis family protein
MSRVADALRRSRTRGLEDEPGTLIRELPSRWTVPRGSRDEFIAESPGAAVKTADVAIDAAGAPTLTPVNSAIRFPAEVPAVVEGKLVSLEGTDRRSVEEFRRLAATLHHLQQQNGIKSLMVTSSVPREGKSLTSANLALTFSQLYERRVLLIEGDLRRPSLQEIFGIADAEGLGDVLSSVDAPLPLVQVMPRLTVLPAGRPGSNPTAGLASERMKAVLKEAGETFDWVILDTPPVGVISDANLMAGLVDGVIFVIAAGKTDYRVIDRAMTEVGRERILGAVLNQLAPDAMPPAAYYDHYYQANAASGAV